MNTTVVPSTTFKKYLLLRKQLLQELGVSNSNRDPLSELSEVIACSKLNAKKASSRVQKDYDLIGPNGERIEVRYVANLKENGRIVWKNWHNVKFDRDKRDKYALVVFLNLYPEAMFVFSKDQIEEVCKKLKKRHKNQEYMLEFTVTNYFELRARKEEFKNLGVQVFENLL